MVFLALSKLESGSVKVLQRRSFVLALLVLIMVLNSNLCCAGTVAFDKQLFVGFNDNEFRSARKQKKVPYEALSNALFFSTIKSVSVSSFGTIITYILDHACRNL